MKPVKIALFLAILISLSKSGYSEIWESKTLSDPGENSDEDSPSSLEVQSAPWLTMAEKFRTNRVVALGKRACHVVTEKPGNSCVKKVTKVVMKGVSVYTEVECKTHSIMCTGPGSKCVPTAYSYIPALQNKVPTNCGCRA